MKALIILAVLLLPQHAWAQWSSDTGIGSWWSYGHGTWVPSICDKDDDDDDGGDDGVDKLTIRVPQDQPGTAKSGQNKECDIP